MAWLYYFVAATIYYMYLSVAIHVVSMVTLVDMHMTGRSVPNPTFIYICFVSYRSHYNVAIYTYRSYIHLSTAYIHLQLRTCCMHGEVPSHV